MQLTSKGRTFTPVNDFQRQAFATHGVKKRDPMYATMYTLKDVEACGSEAGLHKAAASFDVAYAREQAVERLAERMQQQPSKL